MNSTRLLYLFMMVMFIGGCEKKQTESTELNKSPGQTKPPEPTESARQAVAEDNAAQIQPLVSSSTDVDTRDDALQTQLHQAALDGQSDVVELLIAKGADINAKDYEGSTALHKATEKHHTDVVELLLAKGADINAKTTDKEETPLIWAAYYGYHDVAELLIDKGADINAKDYEGSTALHKATEKHHTDVVELLLAKGADINAKTTDKEETPLIWAAYYGYHDVAELLIDKGADINAKDNESCTALHRATEKHHTEVAELLLAKGADVNARTLDKEETPLIWAAYYGYNDVAELLIAMGADINLKDQLGRTPLVVAKEKEREEIVELLRKHGARE
ncbi:ankyrin repeat domain-containing protein [Planctomycetota bacterium]